MKNFGGSSVLLVLLGSGIASALPAVDNTGGATNLLPSVSQLQGALTSPDTTDVYIFWGTADGGVTEGSWANTNILRDVSGGASFACTVSNLLYGLTYYYRCFASNTTDSTTAWAPAATAFTTMQPPHVPVTAGLACWYDAGAGIATDASGVQTWQDISGHGHHATRGSHGAASFVTNDVNSRPAVHLRGNNNILDCAGAMFTKEQYLVVRSPNTTWSGSGSFLGRASRDFLTARFSSYNLAKGTTGFWEDHFPSAVSRNGAPLSRNFNNPDRCGFRLDPITSYMVVKITVDDTATPANLSAYPYYQIGQNETLGSCDMDIAEIIGFESMLSGADGNRVGYYLAAKYGVDTSYPPCPLHGAFITNKPGPLGSSTSAALSATLQCSTGTVYSVRVYWDTLDGGTDESRWGNSLPAGTWTNGTLVDLSCTVAGLLPGTAYFFTFRATNDADDVWAPNALSFQTSFPVSLNNDAGATNLLPGAAVLQGELTSGPAGVTVYWGPSDGGTNASGWAHASALDSMSAGSFSVTASPLVYGLTYYYRCYGSNGNGTAWAPNTSSFTTLRPQSVRLGATNNLVCWFDAGAGVRTNAAGVIQQWDDISGNGHDAVLIRGEPALAPNQIASTKPVARFRGGHLSISGPMFAREQYVVVRSPTETWNGYGAILGTRVGRNYLFNNGGTSFNDFPAALTKDGVNLPAFDMAPITNYMVLKITANDNAAGTHEIGRCDGYACDFDVAEILAYSASLTPEDEAAAGVYLAAKYGLPTACSAPTNLVPACSIADRPVSIQSSASAVLGAALACPGAVYSVSAYWGTSDAGTNAALWANSSFAGAWTNVDATNISVTAAGLTPDTQYYFTFCASNALDSIWATNVLSFRPGSLTIDNGRGATNLAAGVAQLRGTLAGQSGDVSVYWGASDGGTNAADWSHTNTLSGAAAGDFDSIAANLSAGLTYFYRCYASNTVSGATAWAPSTASFAAMQARPPSLSVTNNLVCWYDAAAGITTNSDGVVQTWADLSGYAHAGTRASGAPRLAPDQLHYSMPAVQFRGNDDWFDIAGTFFAKDQFLVVRSPNATWSGSGSFLGRKNTTGNFLDARPSSYNFAAGTSGFWQDWYPESVFKDGRAIPPEGMDNQGAFLLAPLTNYMVLRITVQGSVPDTSYQIGQNDNLGSSEFDVAEILAYSSERSRADATAISLYLAEKYGLSTALYPPLPPAGLSATSPDIGMIILSWTASDRATGYNVKRATGIDQEYVTIGTASGTTYRDATAASGVFYYYVVSATNANGESGDSNVLRAHVRPPGLVITIR